MSVKNDFIMPIIVLLFICFFVSGALAVVNSITKPVIMQAEAERAAEQKKQIMPQADEFITLNIDSIRSEGNLPRAVTNIYRAANNTGFIVAVSIRGFGREDIKLLCAIDMNGRVIRASILSHSETDSYAARVFNERYIGQFWGRDRNGISVIDTISGATITSGAFKKAIEYSLEAFEVVTNRGIRYE